MLRNVPRHQKRAIRSNFFKATSSSGNGAAMVAAAAATAASAAATAGIRNKGMDQRSIAKEEQTSDGKGRKKRREEIWYSQQKRLPGLVIGSFYFVLCLYLNPGQLFFFFFKFVVNGLLNTFFFFAGAGPGASTSKPSMECISSNLASISS